MLNLSHGHAEGQVPPGGPDVVYASERTSVARVPLPDGSGGTAIRKETRGPDAVARLRQEAAVLQRLAGVPGVPGLIELGPEGTWMLLSDDHGTAVSELLQGDATPDPAWVVGFARSVAQVLAAVHRRGVIHKDVNPANVLTSGDGATLVDFDLATTFAEERPEFTHHSEVAGTLPYLAPEQTGRTGWPVDHRADLYALGATLYELLTGEPPFGSDVGEPLQLIHAHLAKTPQPPAAVNPAMPAVLSAIVLRLLEKEPDQRYQSADGVAHDLARLEAVLRRPPAAAAASGGPADDVSRFGLGERDFPLRLSAPSRLVGRDDERAALVAAYHEARGGGSRGLLVSGAPGVGKSALLDELRLLVTEHGGWLVTGKFDQYRQDYAADAVPQAFRALGRLLLAEPEERLTQHRARLLERLGPNAPLAAIWPEFATLLGIRHQPPEGDPEEVKSRIYRSCVDLLDAVGTPDRPVVMVLDDLQWAGSFPIGAIDALLTDEKLSGVMLVAAFREAEVDAAHPLCVMLDRWERLGVAPPQLRLQNLPPNGLAMLLGEMLRLEPREAARLAEAVGARTAGNPFDTVELVNALRREGALAPDEASGWSWDPVTIRRFVGTSDVLDLLKARIDRLPAETGGLLEVMACLSGEAQLGLLAVAAGIGEDDVRERLAPALEDGLLVPITGDPASGGLSGARFRHDRVLEAAHEHLSPEARTHLHLSLARRLVDSAQWADLAAEQFLHTLDHGTAAVTDPAEARRAAELFLAAGTKLKLINAPVAERYLSAAIRLLDAVGTGPRDPLLSDVRRRLHSVLYTLGRFDDADRFYAVIAEHCDDPVDLIPSGRLHVSSLVGRGRMNDGLVVALGLLADLGVEVPAAEELGPEIGRGLGELSAWVEQDDLAEDLSRPQIGDPRWVAVAEVIDRAMAPAYFCDPAVLAWLVLHARRIWAEHGPCAHLVGPLAHAGILTTAVAGDYRTGYEAVRRIIAVGEARHYEPMTSQARFLLTVGSVVWFESLEDAAAEALRAREGGLRHGDTYHASFTYVTRLPFLFDSLPALDQFLAEIEAGSVLATRTGNTSIAGSMATLRQLARAMRGETHEPAGFADDEFDDAAYLAATAEVPVAQAHYHAERALAALLFANHAMLDHHAAKAMDLAPRTAGAYSDLAAHLCTAMAAAWRLREGATDGAGERDQLLTAVDTSREWLAARAADVPVNFGHLVHLLDAERAWAVGDLWTAAVEFDTALSEVERRPRPWQHALIVERMAMFNLERGLHVTGNRLLAEAHRRYAAWGAAGKVRALEADHPFLRDQPGAPAAVTSGPQRPETVRAGGRSSRGHTTHTSSESIDLVGVLRAAQALSSETNLDRLRGRVVEVLTMMTGATGVQLALWKDDAGDWFVPGAADGVAAAGAGGGADGAGRLVTVDEAGARGLLPVTAFRYAERTGEPVRVDDATRDDRFARDPYFERLERCSLLVVPIQSNGRSRAMLLLENRLSRGAFSADRLDAVMLIAGQLAVCLDNALAERFRSLVQRSSELTLVCDRSGTVSYASSAAAELLGVEGVSLVGSSVGEVVAAEDRHGLLEWVALSGAEPGESNGALTCRLEPRLGEERWAEVTLTDLSSDAAVGGLMLRLRDVTERRRLERALEELATTDPLTGVANRRRFDETLRAESERCIRAGNPLTLMLLDIDHFKSVNDTYGHPVGDAVLKAVAAQCRAAVRDIDLVARVGGEEFAVLLIDVGLHEGRQVADRMRKVIEATQVDIPGLTPLACTVSLGVAEFAGDSQDLMARADAALYRAKAEGRNRVCSSG